MSLGRAKSAPRGPARLAIGDRVRFFGTVHTVIAVSGTMVRLADTGGVVTEVSLARLLGAEGFGMVDAPSQRPVPPSEPLAGLPEAVVTEALWWERHIVEVLRGSPPQAAPETRPRPEYDPASVSLTRRERAKAAELTAGGKPVTASAIAKRRRRYEARGVLGMVDHRADKPVSPHGRTDPAVVEAMRKAIVEATQESSRTARYLFWRTAQILEDTHGSGVVELPSQRSLYRLLDKLSAGKHTTGSARTRRSLADRPEGPFGEADAWAPGELMQIDSTPLDVLVRLDDGVVGRVDLTGMIDVATRTVTAAVLRPTTKSVDASVLLARTATPEPMRPGWAQALAMSHSALPHRRLLDIDRRMEHAAARPVVIPETIVVDHGKVFVSRNFRASCNFLGINFQPVHEGSGWEKGHIERMLGSVASLFAQFVAGYTGSSVERRGRQVERQAVWSLLELQELLEEWIVSAWQNRQHDGLRDPAHPGRAFTPNEKYAALVETAGYVPVALSAEDYIELLPATWRAINAYGVKIKYRTYDDAALNPLRLQRSGVKDRKDLWEIHYDPYDVSRIWVRDHWRGGWITLFWKQLHRYLNRLAVANHLTLAEVLTVLPTWFSTKINNHDDRAHHHMLTPAAAAALHSLAHLSGTTPTGLTYALPAFGGARAREPVRATMACHRCMACSGIHQPVPVHLPAHHKVCTHHGIWLSDADQPQLDLSGCPEIIAAQHRVNRLLHRSAPQQLMFAHLAATRAIPPWPPSPEAIPLHWRHRILVLQTTNHHLGAPTNSDAYTHAAIYPDATALAATMLDSRPRHPCRKSKIH